MSKLFFYTPTIEKLSFHIDHVGIICSMECGNTKNDCFRANSPKKYEVLKALCRKTTKVTGTEIQSQHWGGNRKLSMEVIAVEYSPSSIDNGNN